MLIFVPFFAHQWFTKALSVQTTDLYTTAPIRTHRLTLPVHTVDMRALKICDSITTYVKLINLKNKPPTHHLILYNLNRRTYIITQILCFVKPWREQSLGFLVQLKEVQHVHHSTFDVGAKTVGVLKLRKNMLKVSVTTPKRK